MVLKRIARAKINLVLHVTGQRPDGYHLLDSLVTFAEVGDMLSFEEADETSLLVSGPFAEQLPADMSGNLVLRAVEGLRCKMAKLSLDCPCVAISLTKVLPVAAGIGGGSADAAAALRGLQELSPVSPLQSTLDSIAAKLGADVPMCVAGTAARATGIGDRLLPVAIPSFPIVLANPATRLSTPDVFGALEEKNMPPMAEFQDFDNVDAWIEWLRGQRNDLQQPAISLAPQVGTCLAALRETDHCQLVRMSGSGSTCFGIYSSQNDADTAAACLKSQHPDWWVVPTRTVG